MKCLVTFPSLRMPESKPCPRWQSMMLPKMFFIVSSLNSSMPMTLKCRNNRLLMSFRPPPGGLIAAANWTSASSRELVSFLQRQKQGCRTRRQGSWLDNQNSQRMLLWGQYLKAMQCSCKDCMVCRASIIPLILLSLLRYTHWVSIRWTLQSGCDAVTPTVLRAHTERTTTASENNRDTSETWKIRSRVWPVSYCIDTKWTVHHLDTSMTLCCYTQPKHCMKYWQSSI